MRMLRRRIHLFEVGKDARIPQPAEQEAKQLLVVRRDLQIGLWNT